MRKRTRAREAALQALYQLDLRGAEAVADSKEYLLDRMKGSETAQFGVELLEGCWEKRDELDAKISSVAENWDISRMAAIDRNILRIGAYELLCRDEIPPKVSVNEAIELAKRFSTAESGAFVNGILDKLLQLTNKKSECGKDSES